MFDNIVLDVVIGLVFVYLLYSLLVTVSSEFVSYKLGIRPRLLRFAIERMLNDGYYQKADRRKLKLKEREILKKEAREKKEEEKRKVQAAANASLSTAQTDVADQSDQASKSVDGFDIRFFRGIESIVSWWWSWQRRFLLYESDEFKKSFAGKFYEYTSIKYLAKIESKNKRWFTNSKPSYFSADNFADTLINILKDKGFGDTDESKIDFCLTFNTHNVQTETLRHIQNLWTTSKEDIKAFRLVLKQWFTETMDRTNGWYKQKMQMVTVLLGFLIAAGFNVNSIEITRILSKDKKAREELVNLSVKMANDSVRYKDYTKKTSDSVRQRSVDSVYRLLKKDISAANSILALGWDLSSLKKDKRCEIENSDESEIFKTLLADSGCFKSIVRSEEMVICVTNGKTKKDSIAEIIQTLQWDSVILKQEFALAENDTVERLIREKKTLNWKETNKQILVSKRIRRQLFVDSIALHSAIAKEKAIREKVNDLTGEHFLSVSSISLSENGQVLFIDGKVSWSWWGKFWYWLGSVFSNFFGLFITAVALSFGAPFWFDILSKVVSLRHAGVKPEEREAKLPPAEKTETPEEKKPAPTSPSVQKGKDLVEEAMLRYRPLIQSVAGVKSVFTFIDAERTKKIQINVVDELTQREIASQFGELVVGNTIITPIIKANGKAVSHQGPGMIYLKDTVDSEGSLGIVLVRRETMSKHILSCWHVMKDLNNAGNESSIIMDHENRSLAERWAGGIRGPFDYGLARCSVGASISSNAFLKTQLNLTGDLSIRAVTEDDIDNQIPIKFLDFLSGTPTIKEGRIFTDAAKIELVYPDIKRVVNDILVLTQAVNKQKTISQPGNSGAVIFDERNRAIGMIIGGDMDFTYAIKLSNILNVHKEMSVA